MQKSVELNVNGLWAAKENNGVDLDGCRLITRPEGIDQWDEEKRRHWLVENSYDLSIDLTEKGVFLHAVATNLVVVDPSRWEDSDLSWISRLLQVGSLAGPLVFWELPRGVLPITFAFRTSNGASGLFRVVDLSIQRKKAGIQIRLAGGWLGVAGDRR